MDRQTLLHLARTYESPLYVYNIDKIISQYKRITRAFNKVKNVKINYAAKALSNINILKIFHKEKSGLDTVSIQEVKLGILAGFNPSDIIYTPNGVSIEEIEKVAKLGVQINIDNLSSETS